MVGFCGSLPVICILPVLLHFIPLLPLPYPFHATIPPRPSFITFERFLPTTLFTTYYARTAVGSVQLRSHHICCTHAIPPHHVLRSPHHTAHTTLPLPLLVSILLGHYTCTTMPAHYLPPVYCYHYYTTTTTTTLPPFFTLLPFISFCTPPFTFLLHTTFNTFLYTLLCSFWFCYALTLEHCHAKEQFTVPHSTTDLRFSYTGIYILYHFTTIYHHDYHGPLPPPRMGCVRLHCAAATCSLYCCYSAPACHTTFWVHCALDSPTAFHTPRCGSPPLPFTTMPYCLLLRTFLGSGYHHLLLL